MCEATPDKTPRCPFCRRVVDAVIPASGRPSFPVTGGARSVVGGKAAALAPPEMALDAICNAAIAAQA